MGSNLIDSLDNNIILKQNKVLDIETVFPTTTGCVLTSIATSKYPSKHGIIGWYNYNRERNLNYYPVLFKERTTNKSLEEIGLNVSDIFLHDSVMNKLKRKTFALFPDKIVNTAFSQFTLRENRIAYKDIENAFEKVIEVVKENINISTFTYLYLPDVDNVSHHNGVYSKEVNEVINKINIETMKLKKENIEDLEIIITADHGQVDVKNEIIMNFEKYNKYFYALPGIDFGTATYYIKESKEKEFVEEFNKAFKDEMFIFRTEEYIKKNLFGREQISRYLQSNLGEFISFCKKGCYFVNTINNMDEYIGKIKGSHSGLSKEEFMIPLIVL